MANQFTSSSTVTYDVADSGEVTVTHNIIITNNTSDFYATSYTLSLSGITPINPSASENGQNLPVKVSGNNGTTSLEVDFSDAVVGNGAKRQFSINFQDNTLVTKEGEIWEITTPRLSDPSTFDFYATTIRIPNSFGQLAYVSPNPIFKDNENGKMVFDFDKNQSTNGTITAAFGNFQVFSFNITYHLENPLNEEATTEIALPPDTNYQKMNYTQISPTPQNVFVDSDGNWIATFHLKPREKVDSRVEGAVQLFASPKDFPKENTANAQKDLGPTQYWQVNAGEIQALAKKLKTPQAIYNYVTSTLSYDYNRVAPNVERLGALNALKNPKTAICTEFTDLFIAIARAAGIPAREIEGYAYTENRQIQPLSLVADVLHAWPEYWDQTKQIWVPVDPTWGTTSGIDYFNKLDLRHFAFAIHGADDKKPYPAGSYKTGTNPQKDVNVSFGQLPITIKDNTKVRTEIISELPFSDEIVNAKITNPGPIALYNLNFRALVDKNINVIPPFGSFETKIDIPYSFLGQKIPTKINLLVNGETKGEFVTYKTYVTISNLLMICLFVFSFVLLIYLKFRDAKTQKPTT